MDFLKGIWDGIGLFVGIELRTFNAFTQLCLNWYI